MFDKNGGEKHTLIQARYSLNRLWKWFSVLDAILWFEWWMAPQSAFFQPPYDIYLLWGAIVFLIAALLFFVNRNRCWVQARKTGVVVSVPFFKFKISYQNITEITLTKLMDVYSSEKISWADHKFLKFFSDHPVSILKLSKFPFPAILIRLLSPNYIFHPKDNALILVVDDCTLLNTETDSRFFEFKNQITN